MTDRLTLATSTGLPFLLLAFHVATGGIALIAGFLAMAVRKGGQWHRRSGLVFVCSMIATGIAATGVAIYGGDASNTGGIVIVYFVFTAWTAVRPMPGAGRQIDIAVAVLAFTLAAVSCTGAFTALGRPGNNLDGVPAGMLFFMGTVILLAATGDVRMILAGGIHGTRRLARHLWRMSFALFIASGSFFLGQMRSVPEPIRIVPLLVILAIAPLVLMLYWMWRVRLSRKLHGIGSAKPLEARGPA